MAAKRRARESESSGAPSNTGLIVALVTFVLLTITFGVLTYMGNADRSEAVAQKKKAEGDKATAEKARSEEQLRKLVLRIATGNEQKDDQTTLAGLKNQFAEAFAQETASLKNLPKWDPALNRPTKNYQDVLSEVLTAKAAAEKALKDAESNFAAAQQTFEEIKKEKDTKLAKAIDDLKKANAATVSEQNKKSDEFVSANGKIEDQSRQVTLLTTQLADQDVANQREVKRLNEKIDNLNKIIAALQSKVDPPSSVNNDYPKGQIVKIDRASGLAYINLGTADHAVPGLTFSILPPIVGDRIGSRERKGALELVTVLEAHLSTARITEAVNPNRDPLLAGDQLYNPAWSPNQPEHIAIAGIIDLDGDGSDDTAELVRNLAKQGIIVDAYLDVKERTIKGPGITERTAYFVLGESYKFSSTIAPDTESPIFKAGNELNTKIDEMKAKAKDSGVQTVAYRRFLSLIGYRLPKVTDQNDYSASTYLRNSAGSIKSQAMKNAEKEEKPK